MDCAEGCDATVLASHNIFREYFRNPEESIRVRAADRLPGNGFFRFGHAVGFGKCVSDAASLTFSNWGELPDLSNEVVITGETVILPFDPTELADNFRLERYRVKTERNRTARLVRSQLARRAYYSSRRFLPVSIRKHLQRVHLSDWRHIQFPKWPLDCSLDVTLREILGCALKSQPKTTVPFIWFWPKDYMSCLIMTHDVEQDKGLRFCSKLMELNETAGVPASFQIVPEERYEAPETLLNEIRARGHEINVHDLNHDGYLYSDREEFLHRADRIGFHAKKLGAEGFRSGVLYRNQDWYDRLPVNYDMSIPNVAHLDPQRGGCCTVMPYFIGNLVELPLTTTQDYSLFHVLREYSLKLWDEQIEMILQQHGLISFNVHPDYIQERRALAVYSALLTRIAALRDKQKVWVTLPGEVNRWWRQRSEMELVATPEGWTIVGKGSAQATIAYAVLDGNNVVYTLKNTSTAKSCL